MYYTIWSLSHQMFYGTIFLQQVLIISVAIWTSGWRFCIWDNIHWIIVSQLHVFDDFPIIPPTYSSHWTEALSSVARTKKLRIRAPKFPLLQLLMATPLQMLEVDSSNSFPSELNKQQKMFKGTTRKIIIYRHNKKKTKQFTVTIIKPQG